MPELVRSAGDERRFRPDDREVDARSAGEVDERLHVLAQPGGSGRAGDPGLPGAAWSSPGSGLRQRPDEGVLAPARADDQDAHQGASLLRRQYGQISVPGERDERVAGGEHRHRGHRGSREDEAQAPSQRTRQERRHAEEREGARAPERGPGLRIVGPARPARR